MSGPLGKRTFTSATPEKKTPLGSPLPSAGGAVFLRPCFGISVQRNALSVAVSVRPQPPVDTVESSLPGAVDDLIPCP